MDGEGAARGMILVSFPVRSLSSAALPRHCSVFHQHWLQRIGMPGLPFVPLSKSGATLDIIVLWSLGVAAASDCVVLVVLLLCGSKT